MKLSKCTMGIVVRAVAKDHFGGYRIGHIVGLDLNYRRNIMADDKASVIASVLWAGEKHPTPIHPGNITIYTD